MSDIVSLVLFATGLHEKQLFVAGAIALATTLLGFAAGYVLHSESDAKVVGGIAGLVVSLVGGAVAANYVTDSFSILWPVVGIVCGVIGAKKGAAGQRRQLELVDDSLPAIDRLKITSHDLQDRRTAFLLVCSTTLVRYDAEQKRYVMNIFDAGGSSSAIARGQWDAATATMTWDIAVDNGLTSKRTDHFENDDVFVLEAQLKDKEGRNLSTTKVRCRRKN